MKKTRGHGHGAVPAALGIAEDGGKAGGPAVHGRPGRPSDGFRFVIGGTPSYHPSEIGISPSYHPFLFGIFMGFFMK